MRNLGLLFYKEYFNNLTFANNKPLLEESGTKECIEQLFNSKIQPDLIPYNPLVNGSFSLTTTYPGLLIGSGYNHEIGDKKNELKLGFFFDYTTGLPCIPGSSVKGVLRDACVKAKGDYLFNVFKDIKDKKLKDSLSDEEAKEIFVKKEGQKYSKFVLNIFEGKSDKENYLPIKKRDIFFDTFPIVSFNENGKFLANDYITPHPDPLRNPVPIQFMKILPQVTFKFNFKLTDTCIKKEIKEELFMQILLDLGIGAKTNVGYGQFISYKESLQNNQNNIGRVAEKIHQEKKTKDSKDIINVNLMKNEKLKAKFQTETEGYIYFQFIKDDKTNLIRKKTESVYKKLKQQGFNDKLVPGNEVTIYIQQEYSFGSKERLNFHVLPPEGN